MKDFINEQLNNTEIQVLNEVDIKSTLSKLRDLVSTKAGRINREFADIMASKFDPKFAKYLKRRLVKQGKSVNTIKFIADYIQNPNEVNYDRVFEILGLPILDYFVNTTFGMNSLGGRIRQATPFVKKVSTGNKDLDSAIFDSLRSVLNQGEVRKRFKEKLKKTIDSNLGDLLSDQEFWDLIQGQTNESAPKGRKPQMDEDLSGALKSVRNVFRGKESRSKFQLLDKVTKYLPKMKRKLKREIRTRLFDLPYEDIDAMLRSGKLDKATRIVTEVILEHIISSAKGLYFREEGLSDMMKVVEDVYMNPTVVDAVQKNIQRYMRQMIAQYKRAQKRR